MRDGKKQDFTVTLGKLSGETTASANGAHGEATDQLTKLGLAVESLTPELANQFGIQEQSGVVISEVQPGSPAGEANLQAGDVIAQANRKPVNSVDDLRNAISNSKEHVLLLIKRKGSSMFVSLPVK